jgi:hypothetical protein
MIKGMSQPDCFILGRLPTGMKAANIIAYISGKKPVFSSLYFLFKALAVVGERGFLIGSDCRTREREQD